MEASLKNPFESHRDNFHAQSDNIPEVLHRAGWGLLLLEIDPAAVPEPFKELLNNLLKEKGLDIRRSLEQSDPERQEEMAPIISIINRIHPPDPSER